MVGLCIQVFFVYSYLLKGFDVEKPYHVEWNGKSRSIVPFVVSNPLPVVSIELNSKPMHIFLDTD